MSENSVIQQRSMSMSKYTERLETATAMLETVKAHAISLRVPSTDRDGGTDEPVTMSGWYRVHTKSGRDAWASYQWRNGRCYEDVCTYSIAAEDALACAATAHYDAKQAVDYHKEMP